MMEGKILEHGVRIIFNVSDKNKLEKYKEIALRMGAKIFSRMSDKVTHMVYEDGRKIQLDEAISRGKFVVSPSWLINSQKQLKRMKEEDYNPCLSDNQINIEEEIEEDISPSPPLQRDIRIDIENYSTESNISKDISTGIIDVKETKKTRKRKSILKENNSTNKSSSKKKKRVYKYRIVLSSCDQKTVKLAQEFQSKFEDVIILNEFSDDCTHLILGNKRRTMKVLLSISHGIWILSPDWIKSCIKEASIVNEESYEIKDWLEGIHKSRISHSKKKDVILKGLRIFIGGQTNTDKNEIKKLIETCGGVISTSYYYDCDICITGKRLYQPTQLESFTQKVPIIKEEWILDSISNWRKLSIEDYIAKEDNKKRNKF